MGKMFLLGTFGETTNHKTTNTLTTTTTTKMH
ncbi:hypothetical protein QTP86_004429 [Hemibagrus guttatus]|nr:hypothetical protein QTP86_004429 [Hemibagrus guttatus]